MTDERNARWEELWGIVLDYISAVDDEVENLNAMRARYTERFQAFCDKHGRVEAEAEKLLAELSKKIGEIE